MFTLFSFLYNSNLLSFKETEIVYHNLIVGFMMVAALSKGPVVNLSRGFPLALVTLSPSHLRNLAPGTGKKPKWVFV